MSINLLDLASEVYQQAVTAEDDDDDNSDEQSIDVS